MIYIFDFMQNVAFHGTVSLSFTLLQRKFSQIYLAPILYTRLEHKHTKSWHGEVWEFWEEEEGNLESQFSSLCNKI